jgi:uncharacterized protein (DUF924 family)
VVVEILSFWFSGRVEPLWFSSEPALDAELRERFGTLVSAAFAGELDDWLETPEGALALVILLDQFPRNIYRGTPAAFAADAKARDVAERALARGHDHQVEPARRMFFYLPFEHSEQLADQERSLALFTALGDAELLDYAVRHHEIIARFGRFPHRNAVLGRPSTLEEQAFLTQPGSAF